MAIPPEVVHEVLHFGVSTLTEGRTPREWAIQRLTAMRTRLRAKRLQPGFSPAIVFSELERKLRRDLARRVVHVDHDSTQAVIAAFVTLVGARLRSLARNYGDRDYGND